MATLAALGLMIANPFGWQAATLHASRLWYSRLTAVTETASEADKIAVLLLDEPAMEELGGRWPPDLDAWTRLLGRVQEALPKAVFIDVVLGVQRGTRGDLADLVDAIAVAPGTAAGTGRQAPVVLAESGRAAAAAHGDLQIRCEAGMQHGLARRTAVLPELACAAEALAVIDWPINANDDRTYPLAACLGRGFQQDAEPGQREGEVLCLPSARPPVTSNYLLPVETRLPAAVLAGLACTSENRGRPAWCAEKPDWLAGKEHLLEGYGLLPGWSLRADAMQAHADDVALGTRCTIYRSGKAGWNDRIVQGAILAKALGMPDRLLLTLGDLIQSPDAPGYQPLVPDFTAEARPWKGHQREPCLPFPVFSASTILSDNQTVAAAAKRLLQDRFVLIGDATLGSPDRVASPLHATVPGVVLHAVALETLLRFGPRYPRAGQPTNGLVEYVYTLGLVGIAAWLAYVRGSLIEPRPDRAKEVPGTAPPVVADGVDLRKPPAPPRKRWQAAWIFRAVMLVMTLGLLWIVYWADPTGGDLIPADPLRVILLSLGVAEALLSTSLPREPLPELRFPHGP